MHIREKLSIREIARRWKGSGLEIPTSLMQPCPARLPRNSVRGRAVLENMLDNAAIYRECTDGKQALINAVK
jgi:hypothetical protein